MSEAFDHYILDQQELIVEQETMTIAQAVEYRELWEKHHITIKDYLAICGTKE